MITAQLKGGIGNVMFQIAAGYGLAARLKTGVAFDLFEPGIIKQRAVYHGITNYSYADNILSNISNHKFDENIVWKTLNEHQADYRKRNLNKLSRGNINYKLVGYFQSESYFQHIREEILNIYKIPLYIERYIAQKYGHIYKESHTVSLHVRRGDYLNLAESHPLCELQYYYDAIDRIVEQNTIILIFSDDLEWCRNNLRGKNYIYIQELDYISLFMMSLCEHNIIANSSFSWWGAWLNDSRSKRVIAPRPWLGTCHSDSSWWDENIYCKDWEVIGE